jgi:hypothetical protein
MAKYYVGFIAGWKGGLAPMVYSSRKENVEEALKAWSDRETKIEYLEDTKIVGDLMRKYPGIELTGLKRV